MSQSNQSSDVSNLQSEKTLQLLLFIDNRRRSRQNIDEIKKYLDNLTAEFEFQLEVLEISKQPHLVEHFRLVATPALVKINPPPQQTLAGDNLTAQLRKWWDKWQSALDDFGGQNTYIEDSVLQTCLPSSELIRLSDQLFQLKQEIKELEKQLKFKDKMLDMLAHDLRNPLAAASLAVETIDLVKNKYDIEKQEILKKELVKTAKNRLDLMKKIILHLLQASKGVNGQLTITPTKLNLMVLVDEIIKHTNHKVIAKQQKLTKDIPQDLPLAYADGTLIRQVIINLLENAIKYTPSQGNIVISILHKTTQKIQVSIIDTGSGIPTEKKEKIFEGHFRLQRDEKKDGYGIGLALCRQIVNAHYGQIWVDDNNNKGSCFRFTLPVFR